MGGATMDVDVDLELYDLRDDARNGDEPRDSIGPEDGVSSVPVEEEPAESSWRMLAQALPSTLIAGLGMVAAGIVFNIVQDWAVFQVVPELFILIPPLLGLKGNLEMTLAARLSTQANLGNMDTAMDVWRLCFANLALVQVQSGVVGVFASCIALALTRMNKQGIVASHVLVLFSGAAVTSLLTSLALGGITCVLVVACHRFNINPDNVAAPLAASLGDVTTISILAVVASFMNNLTTQGLGLPGMIIGFTLLPVPVCCYFAWRSVHTKEVLYSGWTPVLLSMVISSGGGFVLDKAVAAYNNMSIFSPLVNGIGGNLVAVHASRLSTFLHRQTQLLEETTLPCIDATSVTAPPKPSLTLEASLQYKSLSLSSFKVLIGLLAPAHLIFFTLIGLLKPSLEHGSTLPIPAPFFSFVFISSVLQVLVLLLVSHWLVHFQWSGGRDPDSCTIPYLTALGDLLGTGLLALAFFTFSSFFGGVATPVPPMTSTGLPLNVTAALPAVVTTVLPAIVTSVP